MDYKSRIITYGELRQGLIVEKDKYGIASYEYDARRKAFLSNPAGAEDEEPYMFLAFDGDVPVGRNMFFKTRLKVGDIVLTVHTGSSFYVEESYRKEGVGGFIFWDSRELNLMPTLAAGISDDAIPLYKRMKHFIFEFPRMMLLRDTKPLLRKKGINGFLLSVTGCIGNMLLRCFYGILRLFNHLPKGYTFSRLEEVPEWVDDITMNDGHKYGEVHDHLWLQWCIDNKFTSNPHDGQAFYAVYQGEKPVGFFMTKVRYRDELKGMHNVVLGSIVEWGVVKDSPLREIDLYKMALDTFPKDVTIIQTASNDVETIKGLIRMGFIHKGDHRITFKESINKKNRTLLDASEESLWRLRFGYADLVLF